MRLLGIMGCGRSKNQSPQNGGHSNQDTTMVTADQKNGKKKKLKGGKKDSKETLKDETKEKKSGSNNQNIPSLAVNGMIQPPTLHDVEVPILIEKENKMSKTALKDGKVLPGNHPNIKITHSQIEFFKMLDDKIEQGDDYRSEEGIEILTPSP